MNVRNALNAQNGWKADVKAVVLVVATLRGPSPRTDSETMVDETAPAPAAEHEVRTKTLVARVAEANLM